MTMPDANLPDYGQIVKFLFQPFLTDAAAIGVDCELTLDRHRVWIRVAVASDDRGNAFGRGGRNIQAVRTVLQAAAAMVGQSIHLDVYGSSSYRDADDDREASRGAGNRSGGEHRSSDSRPPRIAPTRRSPDRQERGDGNGQTPAVPPPRPRRSAS
ncbi:KH domain-containing protein [Chamaesiphon sp. VAR_69_metabat_338]|uniref:KH domain-containing protein n=1 Tax=Chamaesiphon sp. VAR_69_metabat_338 TaxID=2964704 RepID=UPI00286D8B75|nr:KH domain-containing protein [Chamaesiphon sp. VAR_69_metabat_338]